jgi:hypothetical protein
MRKAGWWQMTMAMTGPMPMTQTMQVCTDASVEKPGQAFEGMRRRGDCTPGPVERTPQGWRFSTTCKAGNMTIQTSGVASGDFKAGYHVDSTTRMSPAPMPQMAETHMSMDAKWLGACPAGRKPGDMVMGGRSMSPPHPAG